MFHPLTIPALTLLILVVLSTTGSMCLAQSLLWTCPAPSDNESVHFPDIIFNQNSLENSVRDSPYLSDIGVHIYRFQPMITDSQCNGETFVQFCFENSENSTNIEMLVVLGTILFIEPDGRSLTGRILEQISINTTVECIPELSNDSLCCHSERIDITLTNETNAFAIQFPNQILLEYNTSESQSKVETFVATRANVIGVGSNGLSIIQANGNFMDLNLRFIQFIINPQNATTTNLPTSIIIISTVVPLGSLMLVLVIIALIIAGTQNRKRKKRRKEALNQLTGDNNDHDLVLYNDEADSVDNNYDYAMVSGEFIPPPITPDQEEPTDQQLYESVEFQASLKSDIHENNEMTTNSEARPVSNSVSTGAEAKARLSATVTSETEAYSTDTASREAVGESIVVEKDAAYPSAIVRDNSPREELDGYTLLYVAPASDEHSLYSQFSKIKIQRLNKHTISKTDLLGAGQFGTVHKGEWMTSEGGEKIEVAVKTLKEGAGEGDKVKFLQEAAIMGQFSHPNVVKLFGVVIERKLIMLILELLSKGDLQHVLRESNSMDPDLPHTLLSYCRQVASGMSYLSSKLFIHRDLAARNILVSEDGACKVADFGMARDLTDTDYYISHGGKIPIKWTAPEAIYYKKYSTASDVWSFGCVMYEIWSLGHAPFEMHTSTECVKVIVINGIRLAPPPGCPRVIYKLMMDCWHPESSSRPDFASMSQQLSLPDTKLLKWSEEDKATDPEAASLGVGLDKTTNLYIDLQKQYNVHSV